MRSVTAIVFSLLFLPAVSSSEIAECTADDVAGTTCPVTCSAEGNYLVFFQHPPEHKTGALKVCATSAYGSFKVALETAGVSVPPRAAWDTLDAAQQAICLAVLNEGTIRQFQERVDLANRELAIIEAERNLEDQSVRPIDGLEE